MTEDKKTSEKVGKIYKQIPLIMADTKAIGKDQKNVQQGFAYRGIDDVYNELQQHLSKHKVFSVPRVLAEQHGIWKTSTGKDMNHRALTVEYTFYAEDGSSVAAVVMGEALDMGDKAASKAMAIAHKYALFQVFCIPTGDAGKDPDRESHQATRQNGGGQKPAPGSLEHAKQRQAEEAKKPQGERPAIPVTMTVRGEQIEIDYWEVLRMFASAKAEIIKLVGEKEGKSAYYDVLGNHGYEKSNLIPKSKMNEIFQDLKPKYKELKEELEEQGAAEKDKDKDGDKKEDKKADPPKESKGKDKDIPEEKKPPGHMRGGPTADDDIPF